MSAQTATGAIDWAALHERIRVAMEGLERGFEPDAVEVERRLAERAERLARAATAPPAAIDEIRILEFEIAGHPLAVDSRYVREVTADLVPVPVPHAPAWALGVVHLRGEMLTVLDFQALTGAGKSNGDGHLVVLQHRGRAIGLITDAIRGLRVVSRGRLDPVPATVHGHRRFYLGVSEQDTLVLDAGQFFEDGALTGIAADGSAGTRGSA